MDVVYFSNVSENTHRFVQKLDRLCYRIPVYQGALAVSAPYVLILPTYGAGRGTGAVPKQVIRFLNVAENRALLRGVVAGGNTTFGAAFCLAGDIVAEKCQVPVLHRFELLGTPDDVSTVNYTLNTLEGQEQ